MPRNKRFSDNQGTFNIRRKEMQKQRVFGLSLVYDEWLKKEGIPVYEDKAGIEDITELPRRPWARMGGKGTFIQLEGTKQEGKLMYIAEIPGGGSLGPG